PPQGGRKHPHQEFTPVDTTNILFICGGAFVGLEKIISRRMGKKSLGFRSSEETEKEELTAPRKQNYEILTRPKNAIVKQYQRLFEFENVRLKFADDALRAIARQAMARKVGARGLRMILEELMLDLMFNL